jgi:hypothetical protein
MQSLRKVSLFIFCLLISNNFLFGLFGGFVFTGGPTIKIFDASPQTAQAIAKWSERIQNQTRNIMELQQMYGMANQTYHVLKDPSLLWDYISNYQDVLYELAMIDGSDTAWELYNLGNAVGQFQNQATAFKGDIENSYIVSGNKQYNSIRLHQFANTLEYFLQEEQDRGTEFQKSLDKMYQNSATLVQLIQAKTDMGIKDAVTVDTRIEINQLPIDKSEHANNLARQALEDAERQKDIDEDKALQNGLVGEAGEQISRLQSEIKDATSFRQDEYNANLDLLYSGD